MNLLGESIRRRIFDLEDYWFEKRHGIDVSGIIAKRELIASDQLSYEHAHAYHAVWCRSLRVLFSEARKAGHSFDNFIDIGSGKGKACFYAHCQRAFKKILGIELSASLVDIANRNKSKLAATNVAFLNTDAAEFELPGANHLVFMFNPFDGTVLERFISNNLRHFQDHRSVIAYANDLQRTCLTRFGFETIFRDQTRKISLYRYLP
jgi:SAM-dependent methyltransferase